jgi:hypothetical protein
MAAPDPFAARLEELKSAGSDPFAARLEELKAETPAPKKPGVLRQLYNTVAEGAHNLRVAGPQLVRHPIDTLTDPSKRREIERGLSDVITGGLAQKAGEYVDEKANVLFPGTFERKMAPEQVAQDAENAPGFRTVGTALGLVAPNPVGRLAEAGANTALLRTARVAPEMVAKGLGYASKIPAAVRDVAGAGAAYESVAPAMAAISAPSGKRLEAAKQAATDPVGLALSLGGAALGGAFKRGILNSKGGKARAIIEERGGGAKAGLFTPGKGGVFEEELKGLGGDDAATGRAAQIGAQGIVSHLEDQHLANQGYPYREGPDLVQKARADRVEAIREGEANASAAGRDAREEIRDINEEARVHAHGAAPELLSKIDEQHRIEASEPYRVLKGIIDDSPAATTPRDASQLLALLHEAKYDFETNNSVRPQVAEYIDMLERYRDPLSGIVKVPERQLNGLRRNLMEAAKVGMTDAPQAREAPLRKAAFLTKQMVDEGPYAALNSIYAEGSAAREAAREGLGLKGRLGRDRAIEEAALKARMLRSVKDPTAFPGEGPPAGADMGAYRQRIQDAEARRLGAEEAARASKAEALANEAATRGRVEAGTEAAIPDRQLLGLNETIGQKGVDENQVRIALERQVRNSNAAGANKANLPALRLKYPELGRNIDLPVLQNARNDLSFRLKRRHGGLAEQAAGDINPAAGVALLATKHPLAAGLMAAAQNRALITGRALYRPAQIIRTKQIARAMGALRGATIGEKARMAIELQKETTQ